MTQPGSTPEQHPELDELLGEHQKYVEERAQLAESSPRPWTEEVTAKLDRLDRLGLESLIAYQVRRRELGLETGKLSASEDTPETNKGYQQFREQRAAGRKPTYKKGLINPEET